MTTAKDARKATPELILQRAPDVQTRVALEEFKGERYVDCGTWWRPTGEETFRPTRKGVSIPVESLEQVIEALEDIREKLDQVDDWE